jgi:RNA polymerase sigma-70 factor (ECF subfamily)
LASVRRDEVDQWIARAQDGDIRAFEALVSDQLPVVRRFARAFAHSDADADDLAQDALLRVYRNLKSFRYQSAFSTWLYSVVRSAFLDAAKSSGARTRSLEEPLGRDHLEVTGGTRPDAAAEGEDERRRLWRAIREVQAEFRTVLVLFDIEGCTYDEVAAIEGIAVGTVKSRLHRARGQLRSLLDAAEASVPSGTNPTPSSSHRSRSS